MFNFRILFLEEKKSLEFCEGLIGYKFENFVKVIFFIKNKCIYDLLFYIV